MTLRIGLVAALAGFVGPVVCFAQDETRLLRFPTTHGDTVIFTYAGNLYTVSASGEELPVGSRATTGLRCSPTSHPTERQLPSPASTTATRKFIRCPPKGANRSGSPTRLPLGRDDVSDRMGPNNIVMDWTPDAEEHPLPLADALVQQISCAANSSPSRKTAALRKNCRSPGAEFASYSPNGKKLAYNRVFREFRTWKRYRGGMADDIWTYDFVSKKTERLVDNEAQDIIPMWHGNAVYFLSDRDANKRMNLYKIDVATKETKQLDHVQ